ncbi:MAG: hypothetical protein AAF250_13110 [Pseudomonadota bacterium]
MKRAVLLAAALMLGANADPSAQEVRATEDERSPSDFVGRYDGSSFETAMGMEIRADGTFGWGVSVGALDMRANGTWKQDGDRITFTSDPKPVPPEFGWSGLEPTEDGPWVRIVWASNGEPFQYASATITCKNGWQTIDQIRREGWPSTDPDAYDGWDDDEPRPLNACDEPETIAFQMSMYDIRSQTYSLGDLGWTPGKTARFEFHRNDLGVADFTGVTGYLEDGMIKLQGAEWPLEMRKLP